MKTNSPTNNIKNQVVVVIVVNVPRDLHGLLQGYLKEVQRVFQGSFKEVLRKFQGCLKKASKGLQKNFKEISRVFQECFKEFLGYNFVVTWISSQLTEQRKRACFKQVSISPEIDW